MPARIARFAALALVVASGLIAIVGSGGGGEDSGVPGGQPPVQVEMRLVRISAYGEGTISDGAGSIACEAHRCEKAYALGTEVVLFATPRIGWTFERWTGCDAVADTKCTISANSDRTVAPVFLRSVQTRLQSGVRTMSVADTAALLKYEAGVLTFAKTAPVLTGLNVGDILLSQFGDGLARRVVKIVDIPGGVTIVDTTNVAVTDVVAQGSYYFNSKRKAGAATTSTDGVRALKIFPLHSGVRPLAGWEGDFDRTHRFTVNIPIDAKKSITGSIDITLNFEAGIDITFPGVLQEFRLVVNPTIEPLLSLRGDFGSKEGEVSLANIIGTPIVLGPVVLVPEFVVKIKYSAKIEIEVNFTSSFKSTASAGATYLRGHGAQLVWVPTATGDPFPFGSTGRTTADIMGALQAGTKIWGVAGPSVDVGPYLQVEGSLSGTDACARLAAEIGMRGSVVGEIKVASWEVGKWEWATLERTLVKLVDKPLTAGCAPPVPTGLQAVVKGPSAIELTWIAPAGESSVVAYEVHSQNRLVTRLPANKTTYTDTGLVPNSEYCYDVRSRNVHSNVSAPSAAVCRRTSSSDTQTPSVPVIGAASPASTTSASVTWGASSDNVGVVGYTLLVNDVAWDSTNRTSISVLRLQPNTRYCFKVRAYDAAGNFSTASGERCIITLSPDLAVWTLMLKCIGYSTYVVSKRIDIDLQSPNNVSAAGDATDYDGDKLSYHLFGGYDDTTSTLSGRINWTSVGSSTVREDEFSVRLNTADTGDVAINRIKGTGCNATIRLLRN